MKTILAERGLTIKRSELYDYVQDAMGYNLESYLRAIILEPGLRIALGDEFTVYQSGQSLRIPIGSIVFRDYSIFVPDSESLTAEIDLSDIEWSSYASNSFNVWIVPSSDESHYVPRVRNKNLTPTVLRQTIKIVITGSGSTPGPDSYLIAMGSYNADGSIEITQHAMNNVMKLIPTYRTRDWGNSAKILPAVSGVTVAFGVTLDERSSSFNGKPVNRDSLPCNSRVYEFADVSWPSPGTEELNAMGGLAYYAVVATPVINSVEDPGRARVSHVIYTMDEALKRAAIRVKCRVRIDWGVDYAIRVYRVTNHLNYTLSPASDPVYSSSPQASVIAKTLEVSYVYDSSDLIMISHNLEYSSKRYQKAYACEYDGSISDNINTDNHLFYVGPIQPVVYKVSNEDRAKVKIRIDVFNEKHELIRKGIEDIDIEPTLSDWEDLMVVYLPETSTGWPQPAGNSYAVDFFDADNTIGTTAPVRIDFSSADKAGALALMAPGLQVDVNTSGTVPAIEGWQTIRECGVALYGDAAINAVLDLDYAGVVHQAGTISFPSSYDIKTFERGKAFVISRVCVRGILKGEVKEGAIPEITISSPSTGSQTMTLDENGHGEAVFNDSILVIPAGETVTITLGYSTDSEADKVYDLSGLMIFVYLRDVE